MFCHLRCGTSLVDRMPMPTSQTPIGIGQEEGDKQRVVVDGMLDLTLVRILESSVSCRMRMWRLEN